MPATVNSVALQLDDYGQDHYTLKPNLETDNEFLKLFKEAFRGREDIVPKYWCSKDNKRSGYSPICANEFKPECLKSKKAKPCENCEAKKYISLNDDLLQDHFAGKHILGVYPLLENNTCHFIAADLDNHDGRRDPQKDVIEFFEICDGQEIPCYVEKSKSGEGYHVYIFFENSVPVWKARLVCFALFKEAGIINNDEWGEEDVELSSFDRLFPNQDELNDDRSIGNLIALPFQGNAMVNGHTMLLDPVSKFTESFDDQISVLKNIKRVTEAQLDSLIDEWNLKTERPSKHSSHVVYANRNEQLKQLLQCDFLRWAYEHQNQVTEPQWYALLSIVGNVSPGGIELCHQFSNKYPAYTKEETDAKILEAINGSPPQTCEHIQSLGFKCKRDCGVKSPVSLIKKLPNSNLPVIVQTTDKKSVSVKSLISDAPLKDNIVFPQDYEYSSKAGISTTIQRGKGIITVPVSPVMIIITGRMENIEHETESLEIGWLRDGEWKLKIIDRETISKHSTITELAKFGCPVTSTNAKYLVDYLAKFEHLNLDRFPRLRVTDILGWQKDKVAFLWGYYLIRDNDSIVNTKDIDGVLKENSNKDLVVFRGKDDGDNQIARAFYAQGTYEEWIKAINTVFKYPRVISLVYFSLMTPFLDILGVNNFTVDLAYATSTGKTSALRIAGSAWGNPDEYSPNRLLFSWDATVTWLERAASMLRGLPYVLDDTKRARYKETISDLIYAISNGQSRGRGTPNGMRETGSFRTILLTCGEQSAVDYSENGGSRGRAISLWGPVFTDENVREHVDYLNNVVKKNFGHAGPKVIKFILKNRDQWNLWQQAYYEYQKYFADRAGKNTIAQRVSAYFAGLATTIPLIHTALPELKRDYPVRDIIENLWNAAVNNSEELDPAVRALEVLYSWAVSNQDKFWDIQKKANDRVYEPHNGWAGRWDRGDNRSDKIEFNKQTAEKILSDQGFDAKAMIKLWKDKGWLLYNKGNNTHQVIINGIPDRCYCIMQSVIEKELKLSPDECSDEDNRF